MKPHELRLAELHNRNARHLKNLKNFVEESSRFNRLHPDDQILILRQIEIQEDLDEVLSERMKRLKIPV